MPCRDGRDDDSAQLAETTKRLHETVRLLCNATRLLHEHGLDDVDLELKSWRLRHEAEDRARKAREAEFARRNREARRRELQRELAALDEEGKA